MGTIAKQSIQGTIVTYVGVAIGFVTTFFVLTRFLTAEEIGLARALVDAATLFVGLAQLGTSSSIIRFFPYFKSNSATCNLPPATCHQPPATCNLPPATYHGFFLYAMIIPLLGFALFSLIYWACHAPLSSFFGDKSPQFVEYYYLVLPIAFFMLYQTVCETSSTVLMHIVLPRFVREVVSRLGLLLTYLLYAFRILSLDGFVWGLCLTYALCALINAIYLIHLLQPATCHLPPDFSFLKSNPNLVRSWILYTAFLLVSAITSVLAPTLSSFFITAQMGLSYTGIFAIATYMAVMVSIPSRSLVAITQPELSLAIKNSDAPNIQRLLHQASSNLLLVGGFILLLIWINIDLIFAVLPNGSTYAVAKYVVLLLGIGQLMVTMFSIYLPALSYSRFYAFSLLNSFVLTASALLLNNYLIPRFGMMGAAWATVLADICYYLMVTLIVSLTLHIRPFSRCHLQILALILVVFALNYLLQTYLTPLLSVPCNLLSVPCNLFPVPCYLLPVFYTLLLLLPAAWIAYHRNLSPELNALLRSLHI